MLLYSAHFAYNVPQVLLDMNTHPMTQCYIPQDKY